MEQGAILEIQQQASKFFRELFIATCGGAFLALMSQVSFPLPFTPIPVTLQTLALFLLAGLLSSRRATASVVSYLAQGCIGLPVFAGGISDPFWFIGVSAGFLTSFIVAVYLIGKLLEKRTNPPFLYILSALVLGQIVILAMGAAWLSLFVGFSNSIAFGVVPFISGAILKIIIAALILKALSIFQNLIIEFYPH
jgi:biotin transport system substrate-specific component